MKQSSPYHPFVSLLFLMLFAVAGAVLFTIIGIVISIFFYGTGPVMQMVSQQAVLEVGFLKILQVFSTFGMFLVPAVVVAKMNTPKWVSFLKLDTFASPKLFLIAIAIMIVSMPLLEGSITLNQELKLPEFLKGLEIWMRNQEDQLAELTKQFLTMNSVGALIINLFMIAILPALEEELFFRAGVQKFMGMWTRNPHLAIWLTAIIFSAIHMQFYGFLPRMLLGALFGYLFYWSKTIWIPVLAHFVNNAVTVIAAYVYQLKGIPLENLDDTTNGTWPLYLGSFLLTAAAVYLFYTEARKYKYLNNGRELG